MDGFQWEHEWVTDTYVILKDNDILEELDHEIDVPFPFQWDCCGSQHRRTTSS